MTNMIYSPISFYMANLVDEDSFFTWDSLFKVRIRERRRLWRRRGTEEEGCGGEEE